MTDTTSHRAAGGFAAEQNRRLGDALTAKPCRICRIAMGTFFLAIGKGDPTVCLACERAGCQCNWGGCNCG